MSIIDTALSQLPATTTPNTNGYTEVQPGYTVANDPSKNYTVGGQTYDQFGNPQA